MLERIPSWIRGACSLIGALRMSPPGHRPTGPHPIPPDFLGVCVAPGRDPDSDDFLVALLRRLGVSAVRLDGTDLAAASSQRRLLERLLHESFHVALHLVQPREEAAAMDDPRTQAVWRARLATILDRYGRDVEWVEIGSTINRRRWAGYSWRGFWTAWTIAWSEANKRNVTLAGPNVTDFEPIYNAVFLACAKQAGCLPAVHTDNLFVERATEPEAWDPKVFGKAFRRLGRFNLIKKARLLQAIGRRHGVETFVCSHVSWSLRRIRRFLERAEEKQADYVTRYVCLAAASGALRRVYWGPLVGQREGLVDDGTQEYPKIPHVTLYPRMAGDVRSYRIRPAYHTFRTAVARLSGTVYAGAQLTENGLEIHAFVSDAHLLHVVWTTNGRLARLRGCYPSDVVERATICSQEGETLRAIPCTVGESPLYLIWPREEKPLVLPTAAPLRNVRVAVRRDTAFYPIEHADWRGLLAAPAKDRPPDPTPFLPDRIREVPVQEVLRDRRNRVWCLTDPTCSDRRLVVKCFRPGPWYKRFLQRWKPSRGRAAWNAAHELLRRGLLTPNPIAFLEPRDLRARTTSYYICERFDASGSVRQAFEAFAGGASVACGLEGNTFYQALAAFLLRMHDRGVYFRDLSAGNVLFRVLPGDAPFFALVDTARARFFDHPLPLRLRLADLQRIVHPLHERGRNAFLASYCALQRRRPFFWMRIPFWLYDSKHALKALRKRRVQPAPIIRKE